MNIPSSESVATDSLLAVCLFAAFADGEKSEAEREQIRLMAEELGSEDVAAISRKILMGKLSLDAVAQSLAPQEEHRLLAYEMARAVCEAGGAISKDEQVFLTELRGKLSLGAVESKAIDEEVDSLALGPLDTAETAPSAPDNSGMILRYAIVNGALELLPETLATMAIIPLQMKMVYRIGKSHGFELSRDNIKEFLATAGVGLGSQMVEGFARKLMSGFGKKLAGKMAGRVAGQVTGSAFSFGTTYAIGHIAERYYSGGRKLGAGEIKSLFSSLGAQGKEMHARYLPDIQQRASQLNTAEILSMVRGTAAV
ncbi:MAG TPA: hypothetical protein VLO11_03500 [Luteolibacter sp.]|nr:hypothetical protein [Luteolibacter sp.]